MYNKLTNALNTIRKKTDFVPKIALVLGSGLGALADEIDVVATVDYSEIDSFPVSTIPGHEGHFVFGYIGTAPLVIMQGRVHYYEGYKMADVVMPIRLMKMLGAEILFLTNASGGINFNFNVGDFMVINDHISSFVPSPLVGENIGELGTRFPDMSCVYDQKLSSAIFDCAQLLHIKLQKGVYVQLSGPQFETPAEIKMLRTLGADAVGMSTVCEAIAARHAGMRVCAISCVSNMASGITGDALTHDEVQETANAVATDFKKLIKTAITKIAEECL